ncbi:MAG: SPFH domain-containing protein, partial [Sediminibacterium sp.]
MEKTIKAAQGFMVLLLVTILLVAGIFALTQIKGAEDGLKYALIWGAIIDFIVIFFLLLGLVVVQPNTSVVLTFFGKYVGTVKDNGLFFVNPLYTKQKVSLRLQSLESTKLKVNDKLGNPIEIAAVILWQIEDTYKVCF